MQSKKHRMIHTNFLKFVEQNQDKIISLWIEKLYSMPGAHYQKLTIQEITKWTLQALNSIMTAIETGSYKLLDVYLAEISHARLEAGFPISEVIEGLLFLKETILEILQESRPLSQNELYTSLNQLDKCLRQAVAQFGQTYAGALQRKHNQQIEKRLAESKSLQKITSALLQKLTTDEVLEIVCTEAQHLTGATGSSVSLINESGGLQVTFSMGHPRPTLAEFSPKNSIAGIAMDLGTPSLHNEPTNLFHAYYENPELKSLLVIPLRIKETGIGVLDVVNKTSGFTQNDIRVMGLFANQAAIAIENAQLQKQAERLAVIEERQRLARELHDSVTQALYSVTLFTDAAIMALDAEKIEVAKENLDELRNMAREAILDMRLLVFELHPPIIEQKGFVTALKARLEAVEARSGVQAEIHVEGERRLPQDLEMEVFRIAQEAVTNTVKHAKAKEIRLQLTFKPGRFYMEVWDNGIGFNPSTSDTSGGFGLRSISERVNHLNGKLMIDSSPGEGTSIKVEVPI